MTGLKNTFLDYEVKGVRPRGRPKRTCSEVVEKDRHFSGTRSPGLSWINQGLLNRLLFLLLFK